MLSDSGVLGILGLGFSRVVNFDNPFDDRVSFWSCPTRC